MWPALCFPVIRGGPAGAHRGEHSGGPEQTALTETPRSGRGLREGHGKCSATSPRAARSWPRAPGKPLSPTLGQQSVCGLRPLIYPPRNTQKPYMLREPDESSKKKSLQTSYFLVASKSDTGVTCWVTEQIQDVQMVPRVVRVGSHAGLAQLSRGADREAVVRLSICPSTVSSAPPSHWHPSLHTHRGGTC